MNNTVLSMPNRQGKTLMFLALLSLLVISLLPDMAYANDADQSIKDGVAFLVKMIKLIVYGLMGATFVVMMFLLIKSLLDWKDDSKRDGTVGGILMVVFIGLMVMGIIFSLGEKAITYVDANVKVTQIEMHIQPYQVS